VSPWKRLGERIQIVLPVGTEVLDGIVAAAGEAGVASAAFVGLGAIESPRLAWFDRDVKEYREWTFGGVFEIANLTGNLARMDGEPRIHCHATIAGPDLEAHAGHLVGGTVGVTCEVTLFPFDGSLERRTDSRFDLPLLDLS